MEISRRRAAVLLMLCAFDLVVFVARAAVGLSSVEGGGLGGAASRQLALQFANLVCFWASVGWFNRRSAGRPAQTGALDGLLDRLRGVGGGVAGAGEGGSGAEGGGGGRGVGGAGVDGGGHLAQHVRAASNPVAARQEELFLTSIVAVAMAVLVLGAEPPPPPTSSCAALANALGECGGSSPHPATMAADYVLAAFFLICTGTLLEVRWWLVSLLFGAPAMLFIHRAATEPGWAPAAVGHMAMAWACGALMSFISDKNRRDAFVHYKAAESAASTRAAAEAKSDFMRIMCHEVRTPLNGCIASVEMLLDKPLASEQLELVRTIQVSSQCLLATVSNFLDYFKISAGKSLDIVRTEVSLSALLTDVHRISEKLMLTVDGVRLLPPHIAPDVPSTVMSDPNRLRGVLLNLVSNACKATRLGSISVSVTVATGDTPPGARGRGGEPEGAAEAEAWRSEHGGGRFLCFAVQDTGVGIAPEMLDTLFHDYVQGSEAEMRQPRRFGGTGLGLSICQRQVVTLGGKIGATSALGMGSTFWFTAPLQLAHEQPSAGGSPAAMLQAAPAPEVLLSRLSGQHVLLAEDNAINQVVMKKMLGTLGLQCDVVANGREAVDAVTQAGKPYLMVLMDMQMPVMGGVEATQAVRRMGSWLPIIGFTANAMEEDRRLCIASGMNDVLTKPVTREKLLAVLAAVVTDRDQQTVPASAPAR